MSLRDKRCVPCEGGMPPLSAGKIAEFLSQVSGWIEHDSRLQKTLNFADFSEAMKFVNRMAEVAESEGHHPDFCVHYSRVEIALWTHAAGGLTENDFILAARIDALLAVRSE